MRQADALAQWIGTGSKRVTDTGRVLRRPDVPAAAAAVGVRVPPKIRTAADLPQLNRPWCVAIAVGLLRVSGGAVTAGSGSDDVLAGWLDGLRAVCVAESDRRSPDALRLQVHGLLRVLAKPNVPTGQELLWAVSQTGRDLGERYDLDSWVSYDDGLLRPVSLLTAFGAVTGDPARPAITSLGRWAAVHLADDLVAKADASLSAADLLADLERLSDPDHVWRIALGWFEGRDRGTGAGEILDAAEHAPPAQRWRGAEFVERLGEDALPAWRQHATSPLVGPHARAVLADWDEAPPLSDADRLWLTVESAAAALGFDGPDEALSQVAESMPGADLAAQFAAVRATGHPDAAELVRAVEEFYWSGAPRTIDQVAVLKVSVWAVWRRVQLPAAVTLGDLHQVIQILFGWDDDHLHVFSVGKKLYSSAYRPLDGAGDEEGVRVAAAFGGRLHTKIKYDYDFGTGWEHEITLEKIVPRDAAVGYPVCVAFDGDSPVEDSWDEHRRKPKPFRIDAVNRRLAKLAGDANFLS
jgi:hypothetical protein